MNIRKRGKYFECRVRLAGVSKSKSFDTKTEAKIWGEKIEYEIHTGVIKKATASDKVLFIDVLKDFSEICKHIYDNYKRENNRTLYLLHFVDWPTFFCELNKSHVKQFVQWRLDAGKKSTTINKDLAIISKVCEEFNNKYNTDLTNPVLGKKMRLAEGSGRERRLNNHQLEKIRSKLISENLRLLMDFALATAMRRSEIANLKWSQVNMVRKTLLLIKTKNGSARTVPLSSKAILILKYLSGRDKNNDDRVFSVSPDNITSTFTAAVKKADIEDFHFHDLRHEAISRLFENTDLNFFEVQSISGHKTTVALQRYVHLSSEKLVGRLG